MRRGVLNVVLALVVALALSTGLGGATFAQEYDMPESPERPEERLLQLLVAIIEGLTGCEFDWGLFGLADAPSRGPLVATWAGAAAQSTTQTQARPPLLRYWDNGQPASEADRARALPIVNLKIGVTPRVGFSLSFRTGVTPASVTAYPFQYRLAFDFPDRRGGAQNNFGGPGFEEDLVIYARADGPGRFTSWAVVGGAERAIEATVEVSGDQVTIRLPLRTVTQIGLATSGIRIVLGTVGPPPTRVFHRIPERGSIRYGVAGQLELDNATVTRQARARFDLTGDGRDDLYYLDTNGNGRIDALVFDRNGDGRISFIRMEGPNALIGPDGTPHEFETVERTVAGRQQRYVTRNAQVGYVILAEDKNGDGDVADAGEFEGRFAELQ